MKNNLSIYDQLKEVPEKYLKTIQAGRLKGMSDIKPQWRVMKMTEVFGVCGIGWKISNLKFSYTNGSDNQVVCTCSLDLQVKIDNEWSEPIPGVGGSLFVANERNGLYTSDEAEKMAYTDAISVATKMLGLAGDIYIGHGGKYDGNKENQDNKKEDNLKPTAPQTIKPELKVLGADDNLTKEWTNTLDAIKSKKVTDISQIEKYYSLTEEIKDKLIKLISDAK